MPRCPRPRAHRDLPRIDALCQYISNRAVPIPLTRKGRVQAALIPTSVNGTDHLVSEGSANGTAIESTLLSVV